MTMFNHTIRYIIDENVTSMMMVLQTPWGSNSDAICKLILSTTIQVKIKSHHDG
jgi:hypothetical protein